MKKLISIAASIFLISVPLSATSEDLKSDFFQLGGQQMPPKQNMVVFWSDATNPGTFFSTDPLDPTLSEQNRKQVESSFKTVLPLCDAQTSTGCLKRVEFKIADTWQTAKLLPSPGHRDYAFGSIGKDMKWDIVKTKTYPANPEKGIFRAALPNLFEFNGAPNRLGSQYWVNAVLTSDITSGVAKIKGLDISAWGVRVNPNCNRDGNSAFVPVSPAGGYCQYLVNLPSSISIKVSVDLGSRLSELSGWFDGRIMNPEIDMGTAEPGVLTVEGSPIEVSTAITGLIPKGDPLYNVDAATEAMQGSEGTNRSTLSREGGFADWTRFAPKILDTANGTNTYWRLSSWVNNSQGKYGCANANGVLGVVFSDATAYTPGAPRFDKASGALKFEVASPHYDASGSKNIGFYDLLVKDSVAKCLWGNSLTANRAEISVVNADGSDQVATTIFSMSNGWAKFKAYGFHYSAPSISVKFSKPAASTKTITCVKGKSMKKVSGPAPKCPAGFKKK